MSVVMMLSAMEGRIAFTPSVVGDGEYLLE